MHRSHNLFQNTILLHFIANQLVLCSYCKYLLLCDQGFSWFVVFSRIYGVRHWNGWPYSSGVAGLWLLQPYYPPAHASVWACQRPYAPDRLVPTVHFLNVGNQVCFLTKLSSFSLSLWACCIEVISVVKTFCLVVSLILVWSLNQRELF